MIAIFFLFTGVGVLGYCIGFALDTRERLKNEREQASLRPPAPKPRSRFSLTWAARIRTVQVQVRVWVWTWVWVWV